MDDKKEPAKDSSSLEQPSTVTQPGKNGQPTVIQASGGEEEGGTLSSDAAAAEPSPAPLPTPKSPIPSIAQKLNVYMLLFILVLLAAAMIGTVLYLKAREQAAATSDLSSQTLSQSTLDQLANTDVTVGEPKHTLNIQSDAVFTGSVLVRSNLQVAGTIQVGTNLAINGLRVTGQSTFDDVQITKSLALTGNGSVQGSLNVQQSLNVNGSATFLGAISAPSLIVGSLQLNSDLNLTRHVTAGGGTPGRANGTALGSGGTVAVSGGDTAGSVNINTGANPIVGCFVTITFSTQFNSTPHIVISPVGSNAVIGQGGNLIGYYITRDTNSFSICDTHAANPGVTFGYDYIAFD